MKNIIIRLWDREADYPILSAWWTKFTFDPVPQHILPDHGFIAENMKGDAVAAGFVYFTNNAPIAYADWYIVNPDAPMKDRYNGINAVYSAVDSEAEKQGCYIITSICATKPLIKTMIKNHGYEIAEHKTMHLIKKLSPAKNIKSLDCFRDQEAIEKNSEQDVWKIDNIDQLTEDQLKNYEKTKRNEY